MRAPCVQDWEYPGDPSQGGTADDYVNFVSLLADLRAAIEVEGVGSGMKPLLLSITIPVDSWHISIGFNLSALKHSVDWFNVMAYDYSGGWMDITAPQTPLFEPTLPPSYSNSSISDAVALYVALGVPPSQLTLGLGAYGHSWALIPPPPKDGAPLWVKYGAAGDPNTALVGAYSQQSSVLYYKEIIALCFRLHEEESASSSYTLWGNGCAQGVAVGDLYIDVSTATAYGIYNGTWITFDTVESLEMKVEWLVSQGLGGGFVWSTNEDLDAVADPSQAIESNLYRLLSDVDALASRGQKGPWSVGGSACTTLIVLGGVTLLSLVIVAAYQRRRSRVDGIVVKKNGEGATVSSGVSDGVPFSVVPSPAGSSNMIGSPSSSVIIDYSGDGQGYMSHPQQKEEQDILTIPL